jgi:hypothetical protein
MDLEILKKKISTFRTDGGHVKIKDDALFLEVLLAWEQWTGPARGFASAIGVNRNALSKLVGHAKKLRREGHFPATEFKEVKVTEATGVSGVSGVPCAGIELCNPDGRVIRFPGVDPLLEFLKKAAA